MGLQERVDQIIARDRAVKSASGPQPRLARTPRRRNPLNRLVQPGAAAPLGPSQAVVPTSPKSAQTPGVNFLGTQTSESGGIYPLDAMGSVGPTQIVVFSNALIKVFGKTGVFNSAVLDVSPDSFFASVRGASSTTDVRVRYDSPTQRWFLTCLNGDGGANGGINNSILIAVSDGISPTITASTVFTFFSVQQNLVTPAGDTNMLADSDSLGMDKNALYVGVNIFSYDPKAQTYAFQNSSAFVIQKSSVLGAGPVQATAFRDLISSSGNGPGAFMPQGVDNADPGATWGFFVAVDNLNSGLWVIRIANPGSGSPSINSQFNVGVPAFGNSLGDDRAIVAHSQSALGVPVKGSSPGLDDLDNRLTVAQIMNGGLWTVHNIDVDAAGNAVLIPPSASPNRDGARWYEIGTLNATPTLTQSGTLFDNTGTGSSYFVPALCVSGQGHMSIGATRGGPSEFAQVAVGGRWASDPAGTLQAASIVQGSATSYNYDVKVKNPNLPPQRWGDYSYTALDPVDDMTFWTFQEYCNATDSMGVQVVQLKAPPPATPSSLAPSSVNQGLKNILVTLTGASSSGSGFFDPGTGQIAATATGGVGVTGVAYTDPTHLTLTLDTTAATLGLQSITVTNPDGQQATGIDVLTITSAAGGAPTVTQVASPLANHTYGTGAVIPIYVSFSQTVTVAGGTPSLSLSSGANVSYSSGSGTATLVFNYTVASMDSTQGAPLDVASTQALVLNGATLQNAGQNAILTLPTPGTAASLSPNNIIINTAPPPAPPPMFTGGGGGSSGCGFLGLDGLLTVALIAGWGRLGRRKRGPRADGARLP
jgi:hypothetical protein